MGNYYIRSSWVSSRTYKDKQGSFSAISNTKTHEFLTLEDEASEIWKILEVGADYEYLKSFALKIDAQDSLDDFINELIEAELITNCTERVQREGLIFDNPVSLEVNEVPKPITLENVTKEDMAYARIESEIQDRAIKAGALWSFFWEITYRCNEKCLHCFNPGAAHAPSEKARRDTSELSKDEIKILLDELVEIGVFRLILSGGEVFVHKDFFFILEEAHKRAFQIHIYTNGLLLSDSRLEKLVRFWPDTVSVSIYSDNPILHDQVTQVKKSYEKSLLALEKLNKKGIRTTIKSPLMKSTAEGWHGVQELANKTNSRMSFDSMISAGNDGKLAPLMLNMDLKQIIELAATPGTPIFVGDKTNNYGRQKKNETEAVCGAGVSIMSITPDGGITPCCALPLSVGNFRTTGIKSVWLSRNNKVPAPAVRPSVININKNKKEWIPITFNRTVRDFDLTTSKYFEPKNLAEWRSIKLENYEECGTHERCAWCHKCPGASYNESGNILSASEVQCKVAYGRMKSAQMLEAGMSIEEIKEFCENLK